MQAFAHCAQHTMKGVKRKQAAICASSTPGATVEILARTPLQRMFASPGIRAVFRLRAGPAERFLRSAQDDRVKVAPMPQRDYFPGRLRGPTLCPCSESSINVASRFSRVSSLFALMTQNAATRLYHGGCAWKKSHASLRARNCFS